MVDNKIIPTKEIKDEKIKEIENFKFLFNTATLKIYRSTKMEIFHIIQKRQFIRLNIN